MQPTASNRRPTLAAARAGERTRFPTPSSLVPAIRCASPSAPNGIRTRASTREGGDLGR